MKTIFVLLAIQAIMGAADNLFIHEIKEQLPSKLSARLEVFLHSIREFSYGILFLTIGWLEWHGTWAWVLGGLLIAEVGITIWDFLVEDRTRKLCPQERTLHTLLTISFGIFLALMFPVLGAWAKLPTGFMGVDYGWISWVMTSFGIGVSVWGIRNFLAVMQLTVKKVPEWQRKPIKKGTPKIKRRILITGSTGFIGTHLTRMFIERGHSVWVLTRDKAKAVYKFGPHIRALESTDEIPGHIMFDSIINLAGARVIGMPWTKKQKKILLDSRLNPTLAILNLIRRLEHKPEVLISASAIGFYQGRDDRVLTENYETGTGFMATMCQKWEGLALAAKKYGVRVIPLRIGLVLGLEDGFLPPMLQTARFGLGAIFGSGQQMLSWIAIEDLKSMILHILHTDDIEGPVNATAPRPVPQRIFINTLSGVMGQPRWLRIPAFPMRKLMGEMSELFFEGMYVVPEAVTHAGFTFKYPKIKDALEMLAGKQPEAPAGACDIYYNEACPICRAEIGVYRKKAAKFGLPYGFVDTNASPEALAAFGLSKDDIKRRLYVIDAAGRAKGGVDAFREIWAQLPGWRWGSRVLANPILYFLAAFIYDGLMVPVLYWCNEQGLWNKKWNKSHEKPRGKTNRHAV